MKQKRLLFSSSGEPGHDVEEKIFSSLQRVLEVFRSEFHLSLQVFLVVVYNSDHLIYNVPFPPENSSSIQFVDPYRFWKRTRWRTPLLRRLRLSPFQGASPFSPTSTGRRQSGSWQRYWEHQVINFGWPSILFYSRSINMRHGGTLVGFPLPS